jgi:hypothetical protein
MHRSTSRQEGLLCFAVVLATGAALCRTAVAEQNAVAGMARLSFATPVLGSKSSPPAPSAHATPHFRLLYESDKASVAELGGLLESLFDRQMLASREAGFSVRAPDEPLTWVCGVDLTAVGAGEIATPVNEDTAEDAFYSSRTDCVVLRPRSDGSGENVHGRPAAWPSTRCLSHEMAHQLAYHTGLQTRGVMGTIWLSEGLAMNFETVSPEGGKFGADNALRRQRLATAHRQSRLRPLDEFLLITEVSGTDERCDDLYAQSWGLVNFLFKRDPAAFRSYLQSLALRPHGKRPAAALRREFVNAFGPLETVNTAWLAFLDQLPRQDEMAANSF